MRAVYIDESGRSNAFYFFGGLIVDDFAAGYIEQGMNRLGRVLASDVPGFDSQAEFHATEIFHGRGAWAGVPIAWRVKACHLVTKIVERSRAEFIFRGVDLAALKARYVNPFPPHLLTLAHLLGEVDDRLRFVHHEVAIVLADDHHSASSSRRNLVDFKIGGVPGYTQRQLGNLVDTIYFGPSHASRLLQAADVATFFLNRKRTIIETDPRTRQAVDELARRVRRFTVSEYVWRP
jgi:hypothetical protein